MSQYLLLIHSNASRAIAQEEWQGFFARARESGFFTGGSSMGERVRIGDARGGGPVDHLSGYMRFDADGAEAYAALLELLETHPVVTHGGTIDLCELPKS